MKFMEACFWAALGAVVVGALCMLNYSLGFKAGHDYALRERKDG
jgi:hypothetical protein